MPKLFFPFLFFIFVNSSYAETDFSKLPNYKITGQRLYLTPEQAYELKTSNPDGVLFVDVRTRAELEFVGAPEIIDINIPYAFNNPDQWDNGKKRFKKDLNRDFFAALDKALTQAGLNNESKIIFICRSGRRSALAANLIHKFGYENVYTVAEGFEGDKVKEGPDKGKRTKNGWKNAGLPWSYDLDKEKMYFQ